MKRKDYERPTMQVVQLKHKCQILVGSNGGLKGKDYEKNNYDPFED